MPSPLRGAIVGAGEVALHGHVPAWRSRSRSDVEIVAGADPRPEAEGRLRAALAGREIVWQSSVDALLDSVALDFVDICSPPQAHARAIRAALERGVHVLCEKPLVLAEEDLRTLSDLAESRGLVLATVHNWKFAPPVLAVSEIVRSGAIGRVRRCRWEVVRTRPAAASSGGPSEAPSWRLDPKVSGGGILVDHGWHAAYVVAGWLPGSLEAVSGRLETRKHREWPVEDTAELRLEFESAEAEIFLTWAGEERRNTVEVEGDRGTVRVDGGRLEVESGAFRSARDLPESLADGSHHPTWFAGVAEELVAAIRTPAPSKRPVPSLAESALCLSVIELARESSRRGGVPVRCPSPALSEPLGRQGAA